MSDRKGQLEQAGPIRVEIGPDGSYGIGWRSATRPDGDILVPNRTPHSELSMEIELGDCVVGGIQHKRLWVRVSCDGAIGEHKDDQPVAAFRDDEHAIKWVQDMIVYLNSTLHKRLRTAASLAVEEAVAKSSEMNGIAKVDWKVLAESQAEIVEQKIKNSHGVHSGPKRFFKTKQEYLNFLAEAARASQTAGKRFTQGWVAQFASKTYNDARGSDERTVRQWNDDYDVKWKRWSAKVNRRN
jgi:hypothetical protein